MPRKTTPKPAAPAPKPDPLAPFIFSPSPAMASQYAMLGELCDEHGMVPWHHVEFSEAAENYARDNDESLARIKRSLEKGIDYSQKIVGIVIPATDEDPVRFRIRDGVTRTSIFRDLQAEYREANPNEPIGLPAAWIAITENPELDPRVAAIKYNWTRRQGTKFALSLYVAEEFEGSFLEQGEKPENNPHKLSYDFFDEEFGVKKGYLTRARKMLDQIAEELAHVDDPETKATRSDPQIRDAIVGVNRITSDPEAKESALKNAITKLVGAVAKANQIDAGDDIPAPSKPEKPGTAGTTPPEAEPPAGTTPPEAGTDEAPTDEEPTDEAPKGKAPETGTDSTGTGRDARPGGNVSTKEQAEAARQTRLKSVMVHLEGAHRESKVHAHHTAFKGYLETLARISANNDGSLDGHRLAAYAGHLADLARTARPDELTVLVARLDPNFRPDKG